jgi:histidine triad (HIT) family protein
MAKKDEKKGEKQENATPDCIFCKIISGTIPSRKFYEDEAIIAFLDINPASPGHSLVVPKQHFPLITDGTDDQVGRTFIGVKAVAARIKSRLECSGLNILVNQGKDAGQVINHFHVHIVPRIKGDNLHVNPPDRKMSPEEMDRILAKLK